VGLLLQANNLWYSTVFCDIGSTCAGSGDVLCLDTPSGAVAWSRHVASAALLSIAHAPDPGAPQADPPGSVLPAHLLAVSSMDGWVRVLNAASGDVVAATDLLSRLVTKVMWAPVATDGMSGAFLLAATGSATLLVLHVHPDGGPSRGVGRAAGAAAWRGALQLTVVQTLPFPQNVADFAVLPALQASHSSGGVEMERGAADVATGDKSGGPDSRDRLWGPSILIAVRGSQRLRSFALQNQGFHTAGRDALVDTGVRCCTASHHVVKLHRRTASAAARGVGCWASCLFTGPPRPHPAACALRHLA
jgi:hypothetical protein